MHIYFYELYKIVIYIDLQRTGFTHLNVILTAAVILINSFYANWPK